MPHPMQIPAAPHVAHMMPVVVREAAPQAHPVEIVRHIPGGEIVEKRGMNPLGEIVHEINESLPNAHSNVVIARGPNSYSKSMNSAVIERF